ncbi:MAG TPA: secretin N-terminal domain-containing protein [Gammaproteobacteria bacterium]|nr:secretin N-terminal domain-containing protein [Gammaproteobacteria bacterium]
MYFRTITLLVLALILTACAPSPIKKAETLAAQDQWLKAVLEYRRLANEHPGDVEYKSRLQQTELKAADYYYQKGHKQFEQGNIDGAIAQYQQGLVAMPEHSKLVSAMNRALALREANSLYEEASRDDQIGREEDAKKLYERALDIYPKHKGAARALARLKAAEEAKASAGLALTSKAPITLNFRKTDIKTAFDFIAKSFGINVIFDDGVKPAPVTLFAKNVTFEQALNLMLTTTRTFYKRIGRNTILIAPDTKEKRGQYEDQLIRVFHLTTISAKDMAAILKGVLRLKKIIVNVEMNSIIVRDTKDVLALVQKLIEANDRKPAEMILDVEILEVNRTKSEQLGLDFGQKITASYDQFPISGSWRTALSQGTVTLPTVTFNYFKQDVDAKILANPKIRVINGKSAKIHIGDRVPLRSSTIQDATGQTRTTFEYRDIGIKLTVDPDIHLDNSVTVKLGLEVSSLGQNLGTPSEPAYSIGTRNADTYMLLRDGETAILGGLIKDEDRHQRVSVPGLGDIPIVGSLFGSKNDSSGRTDVLLTITPRIVRPWEVAPKDDREMYSGTQDNYSTHPLFAYLNQSADNNKRPTIELGGTSGGEEQTPTVVGPKQLARPDTVPSPAPTTPVLAFDKPVYSVDENGEFDIDLIGQNLHAIKDLPIEVLFNPQLMQFVSGTSGDIPSDQFKATSEAGKGVLRIDLKGLQPPQGERRGVLAHIKMKGLKPGISYLVYRTSSYTTSKGGTIRAQVRASRVIIK